MDQVKIVTFYQFKNLEAEHLLDLKTTLRDSMRSIGIKGTIILAAEGFNSTICGISDQVDVFISRFEDLLDTKLDIKSSFHDWWPFRRAEVKIKPEIVTLKKDVNIKL